MLDLAMGHAGGASIETPQDNDFSRPVSVTEGVWSFRFWPLRNRAGEVKIVDFVSHHWVSVPRKNKKKGQKDTRWIICRRDKRLVELAKLREKNGAEDAGRLRARVKAFGLARVYESPASLIPRDMILGLTRDDVSAIKNQLETAQNLGAKNLLNTKEAAPPFVLTVEGKQLSRESQCVIGESPVEMPDAPEIELPDEVRTIEDLFLSPEATLSDPDWDAILAFYQLEPTIESGS